MVFQNVSVLCNFVKFDLEFQVKDFIFRLHLKFPAGIAKNNFVEKFFNVAIKVEYFLLYSISSFQQVLQKKIFWTTT